MDHLRLIWGPCFLYIIGFIELLLLGGIIFYSYFKVYTQIIDNNILDIFKYEDTDRDQNCVKNLCRECNKLTFICKYIAKYTENLDSYSQNSTRLFSIFFIFSLFIGVLVLVRYSWPIYVPCLIISFTFILFLDIFYDDDMRTHNDNKST